MTPEPAFLLSVDPLITGNSSGYEQQQYQQPQQWQYEQHHEQQAYGGGSFSKGVEPVSTIIIKGLPSHTTESTVL